MQAALATCYLSKSTIVRCNSFCCVALDFIEATTFVFPGGGFLDTASEIRSDDRGGEALAADRFGARRSFPSCRALDFPITTMHRAQKLVERIVRAGAILKMDQKLLCRQGADEAVREVHVLDLAGRIEQAEDAVTTDCPKKAGKAGDAAANLLTCCDTATVG